MFSLFEPSIKEFYNRNKPLSQQTARTDRQIDRKAKHSPTNDNHWDTNAVVVGGRETGGVLTVTQERQRTTD